MTNESGNNARNDSFDKSPEEFLDKSRKEIEKYAIFSMFALIAAVLFLSFGLKLVSGILIIGGAAIGLIVIRKVSSLSNIIKDSINSFSSQNERKDDVIIDFSHKIREPLNNLVIVVDMLIESGLQKKQKDKTPNTLILHKVGPVGEKNSGYCFKMLIGTDDSDMYYYHQHLIDKSNPNGLLPADLKRLSK